VDGQGITPIFNSAGGDPGDPIVGGLNPTIPTAAIDLSGSGLVEVNINSADITVTKFNDNPSIPEVVSIIDGNGLTVSTSGAGGLDEGQSISGSTNTASISLSTITNRGNRGGGGVWPSYTVQIKTTATVIQIKVKQYSSQAYNTNPDASGNGKSKRAFMKQVKQGKIPGI